MVLPVEVRHLRYFLAVADELHFGRAAARLGMSQPPLSQRIAGLERELGVQLFVRTHRSVTLTQAGEALVPLARNATRALDAVADAMKAHTGIVYAGFPTDTSPGVVSDLVRALKKHGLELDWREAPTAELRGLLLDGTIDIGVLRLPLKEKGLWASMPLRQTLGIVTGSTHPLARRGRPIELTDLAPYPLVMFRREIAPSLYDTILEACRIGGYEPGTIKHGVRLLDSLMVQALITESDAVMFGVEHWAARHQEYAWRPIVGEPLRWDTSVFCAENKRDVPYMRTATHALLTALQRRDHWFEPRA
jgi:DNA-binding transcriptional LysR family regulator